MQLDYKTILKDNSGILHIIVIDSESLVTTIVKEVLSFAKKRKPSKNHWREIKNAVRLGVSLAIR